MMKLIFLPIRLLLRPFLLIMEHLFKPTQIERPESEQLRVDAESKDLILYQFRACPFCIKVRRSIHRLALNIDLRNANESDQYQQELLQGGGKVQTPCLRIKDKNGVNWLYESNDIISYLDQRFG